MDRTSGTQLDLITGGAKRTAGVLAVLLAFLLVLFAFATLAVVAGVSLLVALTSCLSSIVVLCTTLDLLLDASRWVHQISAHVRGWYVNKQGRTCSVLMGATPFTRLAAFPADSVSSL